METTWHVSEGICYACAVREAWLELMGGGNFRKKLLGWFGNGNQTGNQPGALLLMEEIPNNHLGCEKLINNNRIFTISTGAGILPSTVGIHGDYIVLQYGYSQPDRVVQVSQNLRVRVAKLLTSLHYKPDKIALRIGKRYTFNTCTSICQSLIIQPYLWTPFQGIFLSTLRWDCFAPAIRKGTLVGRPGEG